MLIKVTQSHIDRGCRGDGQACPVALALAEVIGCNVLIESDWITAAIYDGNNIDSPLRWPTPKAVQVFISDFDAGAHVEPFEFELDVEGVAT